MKDCGQVLFFSRRAAGIAENKPGHSGSQTFSKHYCSKSLMKPVSWLYVAALPIGRAEEEERSAYIRFIERLLIWRYVQRHGHRPVCNSK